jgi:AcrR family transcriptional regulator
MERMPLKKREKGIIIFFVNASTNLGEKEVQSMPKIIEGAREKILVNAKRRLFENGYQHLSLREVAKESGIATGTIYNYFANKDYLIANIMLEDWEKVVAVMDTKVKAAATVKDGVFEICRSIDEFCEIYACIWQQPSVAAAATPDM